MKKIILLVIIVAAFYQKSFAQNLLDMQNWKIGNGAANLFYINGTVAENERMWGSGPYGDRVVLWRAKPDGDALSDGGFNHDYFAIDHTSTYRFTIWLKKTNSMDGVTFFGTNNVNNLDGSVNTNPYFFYGDLPELNKWYLLVGYSHGSSDNTTINYGGIYDGVTGRKVLGITDFKFDVSTTHANLRTYLYYDPNLNDEQFFYGPRVEKVNGNEPSIESILNVKSLNAEQGYFAGSVGIKTQTPGAYDLAVNGKIRSKEIKVETNNWPDYVFADDYQIGSLTELEKYIQAHKHLPEMPSAKQVAENGVELGELNKLLLKKVEELTLLLIAQHKEINGLKQAVKDLKEK